MIWLLRKTIFLIVLLDVLEAIDVEEIQRKCNKPVSQVWTFDTQAQSCIERLGCLSMSRANRFPQIEDCRRSCAEVKDLYRHVHLLDTNISTYEHEGWVDVAWDKAEEAALTRRDDAGNYLHLEVEEEKRTQAGRQWFRTEMLFDPEDRSNIRDVDPILSEDVLIDIDSF